MMSFMTFGSVFPIIPAVIKALISGQKVFDVIERKPLIMSPTAPVAPKQKSTGLDEKYQ